MGKYPFTLLLSAVAAPFVFSAAAFAVNPDVAAAIELTKQHRAEECDKKKIQVQLLVAHQHHDQAKLSALGPELDAINKRLKPTEDKMNALKANMKKNPDDESAYETALLEMGDCE